MPREADHDVDEIDQALHERAVRIEAGFAQAFFDYAPAVPPRQTLGEPIDLSEIEAERFADVAHCALRPVSDDGCGKGGTAASVFSIDVLNDLFAPFVFEVDVDVGRLVAL